MLFSCKADRNIWYQACLYFRPFWVLANESVSFQPSASFRCFTLLDKRMVEGKEIELKIDLLFLLELYERQHPNLSWVEQEEGETITPKKAGK